MLTRAKNIFQLGDSSNILSSCDSYLLDIIGIHAFSGTVLVMMAMKVMLTMTKALAFVDGSNHDTCEDGSEHKTSEDGKSFSVNFISHIQSESFFTSKASHSSHCSESL